MPVSRLHLDIKKHRNLTISVAILAITAILCPDIARVYPEYSSLQVNSMWDEHPLNNGDQAKMGAVYSYLRGQAGVRQAGCLSEIDRSIALNLYLKDPDLGPRIVNIGGGNGPQRLAKGITRYTHNFHNIVTVFDNGGSTGVLRRELDIPAIGDIRNRMLTLLPSTPENGVIEQILNYRFPEERESRRSNRELEEDLRKVVDTLDSKNIVPEETKRAFRESIDSFIEHTANFNLYGANVGNIILVGEYFKYGDITKATGSLMKILGLDRYARVIPVTNANLDIAAEIEDGAFFYGEHEIAHRPNPEVKIRRLFFVERGGREEVEPPLVTEEALKSIAGAEAIVIGPGSIFTTYSPNLAVKGVAEAVRKSKAPAILAVNISWYNFREKFDESKGLTASDVVKWVLEQLRRADSEPSDVNSDYIKYALVNIPDFPEEYHVVADVDKIESMGIEVIGMDFEDPEFKGMHLHERLAQTVIKIADLEKAGYEIKNGRLRMKSASSEWIPSNTAMVELINIFAENGIIEIGDKTYEQLETEVAERLVKDGLIGEGSIRGSTLRLLTDKKTSHEVKRLLLILLSSSDTLISSDLHASYRSFAKLTATFPQAHPIIIGDIIDRGHDLLDLVSLLKKLDTSVCAGEHDYWFLGAALGDPYLLAVWIANTLRYGNIKTLQDLGIDISELQAFAERNYSQEGIAGLKARFPEGMNSVAEQAMFNIRLKLDPNKTREEKIEILTRVPDGHLILNGGLSREEQRLVQKMAADSSLRVEDLPAGERDILYKLLGEKYQLTEEEKRVLDNLGEQLLRSDKVRALCIYFLQNLDLFKIVAPHPVIREIDDKLSGVEGLDWKRHPCGLLIHAITPMDKDGNFVDLDGKPIDDIHSYWNSISRELKDFSQVYQKLIEEGVSHEVLSGFVKDNSRTIRLLQKLAYSEFSPLYSRVDRAAWYCYIEDVDEPDNIAYKFLTTNIENSSLEEARITRGVAENLSTRYGMDLDEDFEVRDGEYYLTEQVNQKLVRYILRSFGIDEREGILMLGHLASEEGKIRRFAGHQLLMVDPQFTRKGGTMEHLDTGYGTAVLLGGNGVYALRLDPSQKDIFTPAGIEGIAPRKALFPLTFSPARIEDGDWLTIFEGVGKGAEALQTGLLRKIARLAVGEGSSPISIATSPIDRLGEFIAGEELERSV